ncbi:MAG TPA: hypothetical protein VMT55_06465, partial [Candidatus Sulfotelmatobacter sp.]|nr:hypothetical protein [Candidatus Sulfotelmatobacter sp.]
MTDETTNPDEYRKKVEMFRAMADMTVKENELKAEGSYFGAYFWSFALPPLGIFFFIKYVFFGDGSRSRIKAGIISLGLTILSLLLSYWLVAAFFKQTASAIPSGD